MTQFHISHALNLCSMAASAITTIYNEKICVPFPISILLLFKYLYIYRVRMFLIFFNNKWIHPVKCERKYVEWKKLFLEKNLAFSPELFFLLLLNFHSIEFSFVGNILFFVSFLVGFSWKTRIKKSILEMH